MISASLEKPIPFDKLSTEQKLERQLLQDGLRSLRPEPGQLLQAEYSGPKHPKSDVENLLFYNIAQSGQSCFANAFRYGVQFEERSARTARSQYGYQLAAPNPTPGSWSRTSRLTRFEEVAITAPNEAWAHQVWLSLREARTPASANHQGPFEVNLQLKTPVGRLPQIGPEKLKKLLDGVVAAYQWDSRGRNTAEACLRLSKWTARAAQELQRLLSDPSGAVLGTPGELLAVYRQGVKWNPDDHRCVAGTIAWSPGQGPNWTISGEIWSLQARQCICDGGSNEHSAIRR